MFNGLNRGCIFFTFVALLPGQVNSFVTSRGRTASCVSKSSLQLASSSTEIPTLTEATTWQLRLKFDDLPVLSKEKIERVGKLFSVRAKFIEEEGYEPPQGSMQQVGFDDDDLQLTIMKGRWTLSEDPDDRKDGLWVWGLFQEPLYPFLLLNLETEAQDIQLDEETINIPALNLYAKIPHRRKEGSVVLDTAALNVRSTEQLQLVGAVADYFDDTCVGELQINPYV